MARDVARAFGALVAATYLATAVAAASFGHPVLADICVFVSGVTAVLGSEI